MVMSTAPPRSEVPSTLPLALALALALALWSADALVGGKDKARLRSLSFSRASALLISLGLR